MHQVYTEVVLLDDSLFHQAYTEMVLLDTSLLHQVNTEVVLLDDRLNHQVYTEIVLWTTLRKYLASEAISIIQAWNSLKLL